MRVADEKMLGLGARFLELKKQGRLKKFVEKRRRKKDNKGACVVLERFERFGCFGSFWCGLCVARATHCRCCRATCGWRIMAFGWFACDQTTSGCLASGVAIDCERDSNAQGCVALRTISVDQWCYTYYSQHNFFCYKVHVARSYSSYPG